MKKKGAKGKKEENAAIKEEILPPKIDFSLGYKDEHRPICVKVRHKEDTYMIFTEEYKKSIHIKEEISKIVDISVENIKLFLGNKRVIEDDAMNHDQQINHASVLYASFKNAESNEWEQVNDILSVGIKSSMI